MNLEMEIDDNDWIGKKEFASRKGITTHVVDGWMQRHWTRGNEYVVIGRTTMISKTRAEAWIGQRGSDQEGVALRSLSGKASGGSSMKSSRVTRIAPLICPQR